MQKNAIVFDLGGVLVDWDPAYYYQSVIRDPKKLRYFLEVVAPLSWNSLMDSGMSFSRAIEFRAAQFPEYRDLLEQYWDHWPEMFSGPIAQNVSVLRRLRLAGCECFALTNWSAETFPIAKCMFPFFELFKDIYVSGEHGQIKPTPKIFFDAFERFGLTFEQVVYIDDSAANVAATRMLGIETIHYTYPNVDLERELRIRGVDLAS